MVTISTQPLNFDGDDEIRAGALIAQALCDYKRVWVRKTKRGYHIKTGVKAKPSTVLLRRFLYGDCSGRLNADLHRVKFGLNIGILFFYKEYNFVSRWKLLRPIIIYAPKALCSG